jgi:adenylate kinase family enzyme
MVNREIIELKNEFLKELREIETKLDKKFEKQTIILDTINKEQEEKINLTIQKNEQLYDSMISQKLKIEKITELSIDQKRLNDMLISHEMRINNLLTENKKLSSNYDTIITDNLSVPGYIGASCTYKNLSEYIQSNIKEIQIIKKEKQNDKKLAEDIKSKLDYFMKNMLNLVDNTVTRCKQYTDNKQIYLEKILNNKLVEFNEKNMELRTQIFSNFNKTTQQVQTFEQTLEDLKDLKENVGNKIDMKFKEMEDSFNESKKSIQKNIDEMVKYKNSIIEIINKKLDNLNKSQQKNNSIIYDMKYRKADNFISPSIKSFRSINKREENTFNKKNNRALNYNYNSIILI